MNQYLQSCVIYVTSKCLNMILCPIHVYVVGLSWTELNLNFFKPNPAVRMNLNQSILWLVYPIQNFEADANITNCQ